MQPDLGGRWKTWGRVGILFLPKRYQEILSMVTRLTLEKNAGMVTPPVEMLRLACTGEPATRLLIIMAWEETPPSIHWSMHA